MTEEGSKEAESPPQEAQAPSPRTQSVMVVDEQKTKIAARLHVAVDTAKPENRSSDLVPLNHDYDLMRRELKALISCAKSYHRAIIQLDEARMNVSLYRRSGSF